MRMFSASETDQVWRKGRVSVVGWLPDFGTFVYEKVIISAWMYLDIIVTE